MAAAVVDQDTPHQLCGDAQELLPIFPTNFSLIRQAKISLMHQGSSLQGVIAALPPQVVRRQTPQFRVEQHDQLGRGLVIADTEFTQEGGNIWWRIHKDLIRDDRNRREKNGHRSSRNTASSKQEKAEQEKSGHEGGAVTNSRLPTHPGIAIFVATKYIPIQTLNQRGLLVCFLTLGTH